MDLNNLHCFDLDQPSLEGFRQFISCWLYRDKNLAFVVDPGPLSTLPKLLEELQVAGVEQLDYILLTHIHIDHAGGTGALLKAFPEAKVVCHPQGVRHLANPEKLWQGSQQVLGKLAEAYGEIIPVAADKMISSDQLEKLGIRTFQTPGHAQHHCCFLFDELLFGGEVAGVHAVVEQGIYLRPATPPRFLLDVATDSLRRMITLRPRYLVIAHHGLVEPAVKYLEIASQQLRLWVRGVVELTDSTSPLNEENFARWLQKNDPCYANLGQLDADIQKREKHFLGNSLRGMKEFVDQLDPEQRRSL